MGDGDTARFLGIVGKIGLAVLIGRFTYNLDGVLVSPHRTIRTQTVELALEYAFIPQVNLLAHRQRAEGNIIHNADGEIILGFWLPQVFIHSYNLGRRGIL